MLAAALAQCVLCVPEAVRAVLLYGIQARKPSAGLLEDTNGGRKADGWPFIRVTCSRVGSWRMPYCSVADVRAECVLGAHGEERKQCLVSSALCTGLVIYSEAEASVQYSSCMLQSALHGRASDTEHRCVSSSAGTG